MKLQYVSDLHLEFKDNQNWIAARPIIPTGDVLVIAGDTHYLGDGFGRLKFWDFCADNFERTYVIPGNHEYYGDYDIGHQPLSFREELRDNVVLLNNRTEEYEGVQLIFSTMWSRIDRNVREIERKLYDFRVIKFKGRRFTPAAFNAVHDECWAFLAAEISGPGPKAVVTHHLPAAECNAVSFRGTILNPAFCIDKTSVIEAGEIDAWIYGHSHRNVAEFELAGTKMLTNQLGYVGYGENRSFKRDALFVST